ncbi:DivIVA domain-containing protein [Spirosoma arcticum]
MKITAIEIRQHTFEKGMRGYKTEDVDAFLVSLSQEWERVTNDYKMLKMQLEMSDKELGKLKEVEMTLFRTLKMAEDTSTQITDQAAKAGDQYIAEAQQKADDLLADARKRSALMVQDAENQARYLKDNILNDLKALEYDFKALEGYKENLAVQIRALASNATDSVDRFEKKFVKQNLMGKIDEVAAQITEDLKQYDEQHKPGAAPMPVADAVAELPPLSEREKAIPEAIPVDEPLVDKLNEAIEQTTHESPEPTLTAETIDVAATEHKSDAESEAIEESVPQVVTNEVPADGAMESVDERKEKKSGSFFDQI